MPERRSRREIAAARREDELRRAIASELRQQREDAGISQSQLARAAGVTPGFLSRIEAILARPTLSTYISIAQALGGDLGFHYEPGAGVPLRDRYQSRMVEALFRILHPRWLRFLEVAVYRPVRGVIDLVLHDPDEGIAVAGEAHSQIRRLEQQQRWAGLKADSLLRGSELPLVLPDRPAPAVSRLLLLRSTRATRALASEFAATMAAAYPATSRDAYAALTDRAPWPGASILWVNVRGTAVEVLRGAPTGRRGS